MQELCSDCPLRHSFLGKDNAQKILENIRVRAEDGDDRARLLGLATGESLIAALAEPRPERCEILDEELPGKRARHARRTRTYPFNLCPEIALLEQIRPQDAL